MGRGSNLTHQWGQLAWRCYTEGCLDPTTGAYRNGTCYCTEDAALRWLLCNCTSGGRGPAACGPMPKPLVPPPGPPSPGPAPPPGLRFGNVFEVNATLNTCYRIPLLLRTAAGTLLAVAEERYDAAKCPDNYAPGQLGGHNQVLRRSTDNGRTWGPVIRLVGSLENLRTVGGIDFTNPSLLNVRTADGRNRILYQYSTENNPTASDHGHIVQMYSDDDGVTWGSWSDDVSAQLESGAAAAFPGATPGPCAGVQVGNRLVLCAWGSSAGKRFTPSWEQHFGNFVYSSVDGGTTWVAEAPITTEFVNECFVAALANGTVVQISRRQIPAPHSYAIVTYSPDLKTRSPVRTVEGVDTPTCEGSLVAVNNTLYFAHPSSQTARTNLTIHRSSDGGATWPEARVVWPGPDTSGYSGLAATPEGLAVVFEGGAKTASGWHDTYVKFTVVPYF